MPDDQPPETEDQSPAFVAPEPEALEQLLPHFAVQRLIASGGMGAVYAGVQRDLDRPVAIKILPPEAVRDGESIERFRTEARAMARLTHPHIPAVFDFAVLGDFGVLVMELVDGDNVYHLVRNGSLTPMRALEIFQQVCDAVHFAHSRSIVHGDIKPGNILINSDGQAKLADFGLARLMEQGDRESASWTPMGTPEYAAPELYDRNATPDHRADIYSLGVILHEMLTGAPPAGEFELPAAALRLDPRVDEIIARCMEIAPEKRFQTALEVRQLARDIIEGRNAPAAVQDRAPSRKIVRAQRKVPVGAKRRPAGPATRSAPVKPAAAAVPAPVPGKRPVTNRAAQHPLQRTAPPPAPPPSAGGAPRRRPSASQANLQRNILIGVAAVIVALAAWLLAKNKNRPRPASEGSYTSPPASSASAAPAERPPRPVETPAAPKPAVAAQPVAPKPAPETKAPPPAPPPTVAAAETPAPPPADKPMPAPAAVEASPSPPPAAPAAVVSGGLAALRLQFQRRWDEGPGVKFTAECERLSTPYNKALQKLDDEFIEKGDATSALAVRSERDRFDKEKSAPAPDGVSKIEKLAALQRALAAQMDKFSASIKSDLDAFREDYLLALTQLENSLKESGDDEAAKEAAAEFAKVTAVPDAGVFFRASATP